MRLLVALFIVSLTPGISFSQDPGQRVAQAQNQSLKAEVELELTQTANSYRSGDFAAAQLHAERAVSLDPTNKKAVIFLARVTHQRYKPGDKSPENLAIAHEAIAVYQKFLGLDSQSEEAYKAIAALYASTHEDDLLKAWILHRAVDPNFSNAKRAEAYGVLAGKYWDCSFKFTELPTQKSVETNRRTAIVTYKMPQDHLEFERAQQCVSKGFEMADLALLLDPESEIGWSYKTNLLYEAAKLAEMQGMDFAKANYEREAKAASVKAVRLAEKRRRAEESGEPDRN